MIEAMIGRMPMKPNAAFLLAQVGAHSAEIFAELLKPLRLAPHHSGVIWLLSRSPGISQHNMAATLRMHPSRLVSLLDELEERGYVERRANEDDRRVYAVHLTPAGEEVYTQIERLSRQHQDILCAALSDAECRRLAGYLQRIAEERELTGGVHPGYRWLGRRVKPSR
jgi:DNA-binding MarR family transcriptional regulator